MRPRNEIEDERRKVDEIASKVGMTSNYDDIIVELLLDIRDLMNTGRGQEE